MIDPHGDLVDAVEQLAAIASALKRQRVAQSQRPLTAELESELKVLLEETHRFLAAEQATDEESALLLERYKLLMPKMLDAIQLPPV